MPILKRRTFAEQVKQVLAGPLIAWGRSPFSHRDEAHGAKIAGYRMVRGPDGALYGVKDDRDD
jgi:hypothetical protein